jgi:feruloyl esterase
MINRILFVFAVMAATTVTIFAGASSARADVTCTSAMSGGASGALNISGNVNVPASASCTLSFVNVTGNVTVGAGATLLITAYTEPSTVGGNVVATACASALLQGNVTVAGNVQISSCVSGPNGFQGPDTLIQGSFSCQSNVVTQTQATPCVAWLGKVVGNVTISSNTGLLAPDVSLVTSNGTLDCESNAPTTTHVHGPSYIEGNATGQCSGFATTTTAIDPPTTPVASCAALANLPASAFPVPNTLIRSAVDTAAGNGLPERCIVSGYVNRHLSPVDNCFYQNGFQVQLPLPAAWNGRYMAQGGGGTEGSVPTATGTIGGSLGISEVANGYAIASQDGGHENTDLAASNCGITAAGVPTFSQTTTVGYGNPNEFFLDPMGRIGEANQSIETTTLTAKYLINEYYGKDANRSYWVGCSTGGRQAMGMSQDFPAFFDGIIAGDGIYDQEAAGFSEGFGTQQMLDIYNATPSLGAVTYIAQPAPEPAAPHLYPAFPSSDQSLFETALLQACDALDGVTDGIIDNLPACHARFNPTTATYTDYTGALGPANTTYPLQCPGAKNATCLSPAQIQAAININQGPRSPSGGLVAIAAGAVVEDPAPNFAQGYMYDGGWMATTGIPSREIGTSSATSVPGNFGGNTVGTFGFSFLSPPDPTYPTLSFNFSTEQPTGAPGTVLNPVAPIVTTSTSLDIKPFVNYGHKIIWYHGWSDPGPPVLYNLNYYNAMAEQFGGLNAAQNFSRFYGVPNMDHCTGGPTTDGFDFLTPLVNWVENGNAPAGVVASGTNFNAATYQVVGNYITGGFVNAPTTRSRLICPYPQQARFTGKTSLVNGVPVATNPPDLANAANYACINFVKTASHDFNGDLKSDILWRDTSNNIGMWLMNGPTISQSSVLGNVTALWSVVGQRDFTGNGVTTDAFNPAPADILWRDTSGDVGIWVMNGTTIASTAVLGNVATTWSVVGTGDLNGDSYGDILWRDTSGNLGAWFMNGTTIMQTAIIGNVPLVWSVAGVDSKGDIFWYNTSTGEVGMWVMNGANVVATVDFGAVSSTWKIAGIGDFDGNGSTDILWRDSSGNVGIWLMNGTSILSTAVLGNVPLTWSIAQTGDYNGSGKTDILWIDNVGDVGAWFMNGTTIGSVTNYGNIGTAWNAQSMNAQ